MKIFYNTLCLFIIISWSLIPLTQSIAEDLTFDSFEAAEAAAKKRAEEYQKKMQEHLRNVNDQWEKQQKDLGSDASTPDISKITTRQDSQQTSETEEGRKLEDAVTSSVNKLKDEMISKAGPSSTGFAGGAAGYQWSVKFKNGRYVLSDSYNEAEFTTGKKSSAPETPASTGTSTDQALAPKPAAPQPSKTTPAEPSSENLAAKPVTESDSIGAAQAKPSITATSAGTSQALPAATPASAEPAQPLQGIDPAPVKLPPPSVRLVIQHPTDFTEEVFASNASSGSTANFKLDKFKIPEDTRIKIAVETGEDVSPEDVSLVVTDDQGDSQPVSAARLKNYRHMFRVPSDDKYSASVYVADKSLPGNQQKKVLQVIIPVSKVDFESRTIDNQRGSSKGGSLSSAATSSSGGDSSVNHSSFGQPQQVDLSDLYATPGAGNGSGSGADNTFRQATSGNQTGANDNSTMNKSSYSVSTSSSSHESNQSQPQNYVNPTEIVSQNYSSSEGIDSNGQNSRQADATEANNADYYSGQSTSSSSESRDSTGSNSNSEGSEGSYHQNDTDDAGAGQYDSDEGADSSGNTANEKSSGADTVKTTDKAHHEGDSGQQSPATSAATGSEDDDAFLLAVSLRSEALKIYQSFDFLDGHSQKSAAIKAGNETIFTLNMASEVDPTSVMIRLSDGTNEVKGNLKRMGESFAYTFQTPTPAAFIEVSGKSTKRSFNYRVTIPVE